MLYTTSTKDKDKEDNQNIVFEPNFEKFLIEISKIPETGKPKDTVSVDTVAGGIYFVYEKVRNAVDYRELSLLRKNAIERFLKRKLLYVGADSKNLGESLIHELIKTRYLQNNYLEKRTISESEQTIQKFILLGNLISKKGNDQKINIANEMIKLMACEIDQIVAPKKIDDLFLSYVYAEIEGKSGLKNTDQSYDLLISLYASIHRSLMKSDSSIILYYLFLENFPEWRGLDIGGVERIAYRFPSFQETIGVGLGKDLTIKFQNKIRRIIPPYIILKKIILKNQSNINDIFGSKNNLSNAVFDEYKEYYESSRMVLFNSIIRSVIFLFLTKSVIALVIEVPFNKFVMRSSNYLPIFINLILPPLYLALMALFIKIPGARNERNIQNRIFKIVYPSDEPLKYRLFNKQEASTGIKNVFNSIYAFTSLVIFILISYGLYRSGFNYLDIAIFFVFLSTVSFFGIRISNTAQELNLEKEKGGLFSALLDFLITPFMELGQWISETYSKVNIFTFILDFLIEAPLKSILGILDQWSNFLKEKRDDLA